MTTSTGPDVVWGFEQHDQSGEPTGLVFEPVPFQYNKGGGEHVQAPQYRRVMEVGEAVKVVQNFDEDDPMSRSEVDTRVRELVAEKVSPEFLEAVATLVREAQEGEG